MRGFQATTFTLSDKTETILKNFSTSYSLHPVLCSDPK